MPALAAALAQKNPEDPDIRVRSRSKNAALRGGDIEVTAGRASEPSDASPLGVASAACSRR
jgi:hypothetical protein